MVIKLPKTIIISNRLPVSIRKNSMNKFKYKKNSGGLVTGLLSLQNDMKFIWVGNIPSNYDEDEKFNIKKTLRRKYKSYPVFIPELINEKSYNGYCNQTLWPILHNFENSIQNSNNYDAYKEFNKIFYLEIEKIVEEGDLIWIQDYHLMLLPYFIRRYINKPIKIGFFLHTVFPIKEFFEKLENSNELLSGLLCSDSIAFHSLDYVSNFTNTIKSIKHIENNITTTLIKNIKKNEITEIYDLQKGTNLINVLKMKITNKKISILGKRDIHISAFPIGIDPRIFHKELKKKRTIKRIIELKKTLFKDKFIFLGVDRIDFIKGIPQRIRAFKKLLEENPDLINKVILLQIGIPSRESIDEYSKLTDLIKLEIQNINSQFGNIETNLIYFLNESISFSELVSLYNISDTCLITSIYDGMNLVALEFIASQTLNLINLGIDSKLKENNGILILSEFSGAKNLLIGSIFCNSNSISNIKDCMLKSISLSKEERKERLILNINAINEFTSLKWAKDNLDSLML